jgi:hypothetical protein
MFRNLHWTTWLYIPSFALLLYYFNDVSLLVVLGTLQPLISLTKNLTQIFSLAIPIAERRMSTDAAWRRALDELPSTPDRIPAFFFAHGSPMLAVPEGGYSDPMMSYQGPGGSLATFLKEFGPALLKKYNPKGIVVFSAHWETFGERLGVNHSSLSIPESCVLLI